MGALEIFLVIFGIILIIASFIFGEHLSSMDKNTEYDANIAGVTKEIVKKEVEAEVADVIDEKIEQAEVRLDKITNEKIMALGDFSEDVNVKINKNHDEVMFLYDMLSDKEKTIKNTVKDIEALKASVKKMAVDNEHAMQYDEKNSYANNDMLKSAVNEADALSKKKVSDIKPGSKNIKDEVLNIAENKTISNGDEKIQAVNDNADEKSYGKIEYDNTVRNDASNDNGSCTDSNKPKNKNKEILNLYNQGKSNIEIAKELGLGMGEVKLVIDLFKTKK